jgi:hypothetical protein
MYAPVASAALVIGIVVTAVLVSILVLVGLQLPEIRRYMKIRSM